MNGSTEKINEEVHPFKGNDDKGENSIDGNIADAMSRDNVMEGTANDGVIVRALEGVNVQEGGNLQNQRQQ